MAALQTSALTSVVISMLLAEMYADQINRRCVLLNVLSPKKTGDPLTWPVKFTGRTAAGGISETAAAPTASSHQRKTGALTMGEYSDTASVSGKAQSAVASSMTGQAAAGAKKDLAVDEIKDAVDNVARAIAVDVYSGAGTTANPIVGLETAIDSTGTYAGLAQGTYSEWAAYETSIASTALSFEQIRSFLTGVQNNCGMRPNLLVCKPAVFDSIASLFASYPSYIQEFKLGDKEVVLKSGTRALVVEGAILIDDPDCTANTIYALNTEFIELAYMPHADTAISPEQIVETVKNVTGDTMPLEQAAKLLEFSTNGGLVPYIKHLGATGNQDSYQVICYCQVRVRRRNAHGKLTLT